MTLNNLEPWHLGKDKGLNIRKETWNPIGKYYKKSSTKILSGGIVFEIRLLWINRYAEFRQDQKETWCFIVPSNPHWHAG